MNDLKDKVAVICGPGSIGGTAALALARNSMERNLLQKLIVTCEETLFSP